MAAYDQLKKLVESGEADMIHVDAVPRSLSTAFGRAIVEGPSPSVYVNEPINRFTDDCDIAAASILKAYRKLPSHDRPVTIVTKSLAHHFSDSTFRRWADICSTLVWSVRDPLRQMNSLVTRLANDSYGVGGANTLSPDQVLAHLQAISDRLDKESYARTGWEALHHHYSNLRNSHKTTYMDASQLLEEPHKVLNSICEVLGIEYTDSMVNGWVKPFENANVHYSDSFHDGISENVWIHDAASFIGIHDNYRQPLDLERVPSSLREHIEMWALPTYQEIVAGN